MHTHSHFRAGYFTCHASVSPSRDDGTLDMCFTTSDGAQSERRIFTLAPSRKASMKGTKSSDLRVIVESGDITFKLKMTTLESQLKWLRALQAPLKGSIAKASSGKRGSFESTVPLLPSVIRSLQEMAPMATSLQSLTSSVPSSESRAISSRMGSRESSSTLGPATRLSMADLASETSDLSPPPQQPQQQMSRSSHDLTHPVSPDRISGLRSRLQAARTTAGANSGSVVAQLRHSMKYTPKMAPPKIRLRSVSMTDLSAKELGIDGVVDEPCDDDAFD